MSEPVDLTSQLLPAKWTLGELEKEARRVYFGDLVPNPPKLAVLRGFLIYPCWSQIPKGRSSTCLVNRKAGPVTTTKKQVCLTLSDCAACSGFVRCWKCR